MEGLKELIQEVHRRSLWQVLAIYAVAGWIIFEVVQTLTEGLGLPGWFPPFAFVLLLVGLPIVLATAILQGGIAAPGRADPTLLPAHEAPETEAPHEPTTPPAGARRLFTWRNALLGGLAALALWGVVAAGWVIWGGGLGAVPGEEAESPGDGRKMLVVLPFQNLGPSDDEYFADGITDAITARLAGLGGLGVISRQSAIQFKGAGLSAQQIGGELGVDFILEGTVQRERPHDPASRVRVIPQLVRVDDDTHLWADTYDEEMTEVFRVQSEIAERVARALDITLLEPERRTLETKLTDDLEAYEYYLRGNDYFGRRGLENDTRTAVQMYERAIELDPDFAAAYAALGRARIWLQWNFGRAGQLEPGKEAVDRALGLDPDLPEVHLALGYYHYYGSRDYEKALEEFDLVRRARPSDADAIAAAGWILRRQGHFEASAADVEKALELAPGDASWAASLAETYVLLRDYESAERWINRAIALAPDIPGYHAGKALTYLAADGNVDRAKRSLEEAAARISPARVLFGRRALLRIFWSAYIDELSRYTLADAGGDTIGYFLGKADLSELSERDGEARAYYDSALAVADAQATVTSDNAGRHMALAFAYAGLDRAGEAIQHGERAIELLPASRDALSGAGLAAQLAQLYLRAGQRERAIDQLEYVSSIPSLLSVNLLRIDPIWDPLREHPRFQRLVQAER